MADKKARQAVQLKAAYDDAIAAGQLGLAQMIDLQAEMNGIDLADVKELRTADKPDVIPSTFGTPKGKGGVPDQIAERQRLMKEMKADTPPEWSPFTDQLGDVPGLGYDPLAPYERPAPHSGVPDQIAEQQRLMQEAEDNAPLGNWWENQPQFGEPTVDLPKMAGDLNPIAPGAFEDMDTRSTSDFLGGLLRMPPAMAPKPGDEFTFNGKTFTFDGKTPAGPGLSGVPDQIAERQRPAPEAVPSLPPQVRPQARPAAVPAAAGPTTPELDISIAGVPGTAQPQDESAQRLVEELRSGDEDKGGRGISRMSFGSGIRDNVLGLFADKNDDEAMNRLSRSFAAGGAAILQADGSRGWQYALGKGIEAGIADYDNQHEAGLEEEATRQRMALAQEEMEQRRRREGRDQSNEAFQRSLDIINAQKAGIVFDENGLPIGYSAEEAAKYAPVDPYKGFTSTQEGKIRLAEIVYADDPEGFKDALDRIIGGGDTSDLNSILQQVQ